MEEIKDLKEEIKKILIKGSKGYDLSTFNKFHAEILSNSKN